MWPPRPQRRRAGRLLIQLLAIVLPACDAPSCTTFWVEWSASVRVTAFVRATRPTASLTVDGTWLDWASTGLDSSQFHNGLSTSFQLTAMAPVNTDPQEIPVGQATGLRPGNWRIVTTISPSDDPRGPISCLNVFLGYVGINDDGTLKPTEVVVFEQTATCGGPNDGVPVAPKVDVAAGFVNVDPAPRTSVLQNLPVTVRVEVTNLGSEPAPIRVTLTGVVTGASRIQPAAREANLTGGQSSSQEFTWTPVRSERLNAVVAPLPDDVNTMNNFAAAVVTVVPNADTDTIPDQTDNCPAVFNPGQEDCDRDGIGDACDAEIKAFTPTCNIGRNEPVTVIGSGFANVVAGDILIGGQAVSSVTSRTACSLVFTNPVANPTGTLNIATIPPVQAPLCSPCPTAAIRAFDPVAGVSGTLVTVLGCGFGTGAIDVFLEATVAGPPRIGPFPPQAGATAERLVFAVPATAVSNTSYYIVLVPSGVPLIRSSGAFKAE